MFILMHVTVDDVSFCDGLECVCKVQKLCINSMWIAWLLHGFLPVKTLLLIECGMTFYATKWFMKSIIHNDIHVYILDYKDYLRVNSNEIQEMWS